MKRSLTISLILSLALPPLVHANSVADLAGAVQEKVLRHDYILQLLSHGANPNITVNGCPLVIYVTMKVVRKKRADQDKWYEILKTLVRHKVSVDDLDTNSYTALMYAAYYGHYDTVALLLASNARATFCNEYGKSPISEAHTGYNSALTQDQKKRYTKIITLLTSYANKR